MSLDTKFADLKIATSNTKRRLSGIHRQNMPILEVPLDCSSSGGSSIDELDELNNENTPAENNNSIIEDPTCPSVSLRRSGRKRVSTTTFNSQFLSGGYTNTTAKYAKLATKSNLLQIPLETLEESDIDNPVEYLKEIYLDKTVKLKHTALETIFEEPKAAGRGKGPASIMSGRKFRRFISFDETVSNMSKKIKKRSIRAKTMSSKTRSKSKFNILKKSDLSL